MMLNRSMPNDVLIPVVSYPSVSEAVAWLTAAFGFGRRWQVDEHRAQLSVGPDAAIAITHGVAAPPGTDHIMIRVEHVDAHRRQAEGAGAKVTEATDHMYGERQIHSR